MKHSRSLLGFSLAAALIGAGCSDSPIDSDTERIDTNASALAQTTTLLLSVSGKARLGSNMVSMHPGEVWSYDVANDEVGNALNIPFRKKSGKLTKNPAKVNAVHAMDDGTVLLSVKKKAFLGDQAGGPLTCEAGDVVRYDPENDAAETLFRLQPLALAGKVDVDAVTHLGGSLFAVSSSRTAVFVIDGKPTVVRVGDILTFDTETESLSITLSAETLFGKRTRGLNALHANADGSWLISAEKDARAGRNELEVERGDIFSYDPQSEQATMVTRGEEVFRKNNGTLGATEDVDALTMAPIDPSECSIPEIDIHRSLVVHDRATLEQQGNFSLKRTLDQIIDTSGTQTDSLSLFQQWFNFFNPENPNAPSDPLPRCSQDPVDLGLNDFAVSCRPGSASRANEGRFAQENPFANGEFVPTALFNRFDLAPDDGSHCGEYRVIYETNANPFVTLIFEARMPNPDPQQGLAACLPFALRWAQLSEMDNVTARTAALEKMYFEGVTLEGLSYPPIVHADHYGALGGQIRTNLFRNVSSWQLREFKVELGPTGVVMIAPAPVAGNPAPELFAADEHPEFLDDFLQQLDGLTQELSNEANTEQLQTAISSIGMNLPRKYDDGQSNEQSQSSAGCGERCSALDYLSAADTTFKNAVDNELQQRGSSLTVTHVLNRATASSCAGCHVRSNATALGGGLGNWPSTAFRHVIRSSDAESHFLSSALTNSFLPHRQRVLEAKLAEHCAAEAN